MRRMFGAQNIFALGPMMLRGAQAYANFQQVLDSVLATQKSSSDAPK